MLRSWFARGVDQMLIVAMVCGSGLLFQMQQSALADEGESVEGRIVEIAPTDAAAPAKPAPPAPPAAPTAPAPPPTYWIGVGGVPITDEALRTHLQLAADTGAVVEQIMPGSPAEKAGLRKHDVIIAVNGQAAHGMQELIEAVRTGAGKPVELKILRLAQEATITVAPEQRPADAMIPVQPAVPGMPRIDAPFDADQLNALLQQMLQNQQIPGLRRLGPGMVMPRQALALPNGVSVSIQRQNDQPAQITVKRGDDSWTVSEGDAEAMDQLPPDVRGLVERMLGQNGQAGWGDVLNFNFDAGDIFPDAMRGFADEAAAERAKNFERLQQQAVKAAEEARLRAEQARQRARRQLDDGREEMLQRLEEMERRLHDMQERLGAPTEGEAPPAPQADDKTT